MNSNTLDPRPFGSYFFGGSHISDKKYSALHLIAFNLVIFYGNLDSVQTATIKTKAKKCLNNCIPVSVSSFWISRNKIEE